MNSPSNPDALVLSRITNILRRFMEAEGLNLELLGDQLNAASSAERFPVGDWWALLEHLAQLCHDPHVGLRIGKLAQIQDGGVLGYLAASCETLGQAMLRWQRFEGLLQSLSVSSVEMEEDCIRMAWSNANGYSTDLSNEVFISSLLTVLRMLVAPHSIEPVCVEFPKKSTSGNSVYERALGCPVHFACTQLSVKLRMQDLMLPINSRDVHLMKLLEQQATVALQGLEQSDSFLIRLNNAMARGLLEGTASAQWVATQLDMPLRSVYRALHERGTSFKQQLDELRQTLAQRYLEDNTLSLSEIALLLGYSEQSAFNRAFRKWTGSTPLKRRKELQRCALA
ncbi:MAG TPA: AraC family transcriptional regulator ligand-binding domain-containing protein [Limnobacter sp.]|nr:AraC family transcriptional regulator ligand-binding domain-containing protein [Limnobacter sp.]